MLLIDFLYSKLFLIWIHFIIILYIYFIFKQINFLPNVTFNLKYVYLLFLPISAVNFNEIH
jgi:hypothetical protein